MVRAVCAKPPTCQLLVQYEYCGRQRLTTVIYQHLQRDIDSYSNWIRTHGVTIADGEMEPNTLSLLDAEVPVDDKNEETLIASCWVERRYKLLEVSQNGSDAKG